MECMPECSKLRPGITVNPFNQVKAMIYNIDFYDKMM